MLVRLSSSTAMCWCALFEITSGKKKGETPEGSVQATPTASSESVSQEKERPHSVDFPLDNEEIAALTVTTEDLIKVVCSFYVPMYIKYVLVHYLLIASPSPTSQQSTQPPKS